MERVNWFKKREVEKPLAPIKIKEVKWWVGGLGLAGVSAVGLGIGVAAGTYVLVGLVSIGGIVYIVETTQWLKNFVSKTSKALDIILFMATIAACIFLSPTIGLPLVFTSLGFTVYKQFLKQNAQ